MSDFLGNLAARSLGRLETLTPRLPARFEPAGPAAPLEGSEAERGAVASVPFEPPRAVASVAPGLEPAPPPPPALASPEEGVRRSPRPELTGEPALRRLRRSAPPTEQAVPDPSADLTNRLAPPRSEPVAAPPPPELTEETAPQRRLRRSAPPLERVAPAVPEPAAAANLANRLAPPRREPAASPPPVEQGPRPTPDFPKAENRLAPPQAADRLAPHPPAPHPPLAPPPPDRVERREPDERPEHLPATVRLEPKVTLAPSVPVAAPRRSAAREAQPSAAPQPTIQVTIGRLEVRATPAPAASAASARKGTAPPIMTLEEYLNRRSRGGGR